MNKRLTLNSEMEDENGVSWNSLSEYIQCEILGLCGCGNPEEVMEYIRINLEKLDKCEYGEYSDLPYMFFVYWANGKDFAEHGTSARCSWLTDYGQNVLNVIKKLREINHE
jgi:hypothetical protein